MLRLAVENNSKFVRGRKRAKENIERYYLEPYGVKRLEPGNYELTVPYRGHEAEMRNCFVNGWVVKGNATGQVECKRLVRWNANRWSSRCNYTFDDADLHRHDFQLLADLFADGVVAATAKASQFVFGQFVDDFNTRQVVGQRFAFATTLSGGNDFFVRLIGDRNREAFGLIKERELRRLRIDCLF